MRVRNQILFDRHYGKYASLFLIIMRNGNFILLTFSEEAWL